MGEQDQRWGHPLSEARATWTKVAPHLIKRANQIRTNYACSQSNVGNRCWKPWGSLHNPLFSHEQKHTVWATALGLVVRHPNGVAVGSSRMFTHVTWLRIIDTYNTFCMPSGQQTWKTWKPLVSKEVFLNRPPKWVICWEPMFSLPKGHFLDSTKWYKMYQNNFPFAGPTSETQRLLGASHLQSGPEESREAGPGSGTLQRCAATRWDALF